jgi:hypothetical protein
MDLKIPILAVVCLAVATPALHGAGLRVGIEDIPAMVDSGSPLAGILDSELSLARAERDLAVRWTNPSLVWEMEEIGDGDISEREWIVALEKEFAMPWSYAKARSGSNLRFESSRLGWEAARRELVSRMRHGYVKIKLRDIEAEILEFYRQVIGDATRIIADRKEQGTVSGLEKRLIDMSLLTFQAGIIDNRLERREIMDEWKAAMGIGPDIGVELTSELDLGTGWLAYEEQGAVRTFDMESRRFAVEALGAGIGREKADILPSISLAGGYKNVNDEFTGFVVGLSMPIPLLNRNSGGIDRASAGHRLATAELDLYETARERRISRLLSAAGEHADLLEQYRDDFDSIEDHVRDLALAYREGWVDLGDFLEGIRTFAEGTESYFDMLEHYHDMVFELEMLTEREIYMPAAAGREDNGS